MGLIAAQFQAVLVGTDGKVNLAASTFGKITGKGGNRELQFALRYQF